MTVYADLEKIRGTDNSNLTTPCLLKPRFWGRIFYFGNLKVVVNNDHLSATTTNLGFRGWSLYTSLFISFQGCFERTGPQDFYTKAYKTVSKIFWIKMI